MEVKKKVFVTGCFDMLHSGHVAFLEEAAQIGDLYVGIGSDNNVKHLKGRFPVNTQDERLYMLKALKCVTSCHVNTGWGIMDFTEDVDAIHPDVFFVNEDGNSPEKELFCKERNLEYLISRRIPKVGLPVRSTTSLRTECRMPFRVDLAGGWLDQPYVSKHYPGPVVTICIEPTVEFNDRSGMSTSTRRVAIRLWQTDIPAGDKEKLAHTLFCCENPPGTKIISGSQDSLGIVYPGLNRFEYHDNYWPSAIDSVLDESVISFIENNLYLRMLEPRDSSYNVLEGTHIDEAGAKCLSIAAQDCWNAALAKDLKAFGQSITDGFNAQIRMFPNMVDKEILEFIGQYKDIALGWKLSGAGGGGYLILVSDKPIDGTIQIKIRR